MKDQRRRRAARKVAQVYAPRPESSLAMYAAIGIVLGGLSVLLFGQFYGIDPLAHPVEGLTFIVLVLAGATGLWLLRKRRHTRAHRAEYNKDVR